MIMKVMLMITMIQIYSITTTINHHHWLKCPFTSDAILSLFPVQSSIQSSVIQFLQAVSKPFHSIVTLCVAFLSCQQCPLHLTSGFDLPANVHSADTVCQKRCNFHFITFGVTFGQIPLYSSPILIILANVPGNPQKFPAAILFKSKYSPFQVFCNGPCLTPIEKSAKNVCLKYFVFSFQNLLLCPSKLCAWHPY